MNKAPRRGMLPRLLLLGAAVFLLACDYGSVTFYEPESPDEVPLTIRAVAAESEQASGLGWDGASIPGAQLTLTLTDSTRGVVEFEALTDSAGAALFTAVPVGSYVLEVRRVLTFAEIQAAGGGVAGFVGRAFVRVEPSASEVEVPVPASVRRGLVISEMSFAGRIGPTGSYDYDGYIELYNNADTTAYLGGKVILKGFDLGFDYPDRPCSMFEHLRLDPGGIWARFFEAFPGGPRDYPVEPGELITVATDAIDHEPLIFGGLDLTGADFEFFGGGSDVDNPAVPNMIDIGLGRWPTGHGLSYVLTAQVPVITHSVDVGSLPIDREPDTGRQYVRLPAATIVDAASFMSDAASSYERCPALLNAFFDKGYGTRVSEFDYTLSNQRKILLELPDGRKVLQDVNWSLIDFEHQERTFGTLP